MKNNLTHLIIIIAFLIFKTIHNRNKLYSKNYLNLDNNEYIVYYIYNYHDENIYFFNYLKLS